MFIIFFISLCIVVTLVVGLSAHFARHSTDESPPAVPKDGPA